MGIFLHVHFEWRFRATLIFNIILQTTQTQYHRKCGIIDLIIDTRILLNWSCGVIIDHAGLYIPFSISPVKQTSTKQKSSSQIENLYMVNLQTSSKIASVFWKELLKKYPPNLKGACWFQNIIWCLLVCIIQGSFACRSYFWIGARSNLREDKPAKRNPASLHAIAVIIICEPSSECTKFGGNAVFCFLIWTCIPTG